MIIVPANTLSTGAFEVTNSCRFNKANSPYLYKTQSAGNRDKWSFSLWVKIGAKDGILHYVLGAKSDASNYTNIEVGDASEFLRFGNLVGGGYNSFKKSTQEIRDPSAWYHLLYVYDSGNANTALRQLIYLNGVQVTSFASDTTTTLNQDSFVNDSGSSLHIGNLEGESSWFDGYMAEVVLLDGTAASPTDFGEFDEDSPTIWKPKDPSGLAFGTNGFYLDFKDSSNLGNDANGGTDLTESGIDAADQSVDTPTNNFCTMNPLDNFYKAATFSEGNCLTVGGASSKNSWITSTFALTKGKWYCEFVVPDVATDHSNVSWGISDRVTIASATALGSTAGFNQCGFRMHNGHKRLNGTSSAYGNAYTLGQVVGMALNLDDSELKYYINNTVQNSGTAISITAVASTLNGYYFIACGDETDQNGTLAFNFGGCSGFAVSSAESDENGYGNFEYAPPTGFYAICTKNLAEYG